MDEHLRMEIRLLDSLSEKLATGELEWVWIRMSNFDVYANWADIRNEGKWKE